MDVLFLVMFLVYALVMLVLFVFNVMAIRHILKFRFKGDISMVILLGYVIVIGVLLVVTSFSLFALSIFNPGGWA